MISDMLKDQPLPDNLNLLSDELEKVLRIVNDAITPEHVATAKKCLRNFTVKWQLSTKKRPNTILIAIEEKINAKLVEWEIQDNKNADNATVKRTT